jgi:formylglycine-generating enzyme required for sulfatase activity
VSWRKKATALPWLFAAAVLVVAGAVVLRNRGAGGAECGFGFVSRGARCVVAPDSCPAPLVRANGACDVPPVRVSIPTQALTIGPSDWEAEGLVAPRKLTVAPFWIDAFEATRGALSKGDDPDDARTAASGLTRDEAAAFCASRGGRLPTDDEWLAAASAGSASAARGLVARYPWGETGAVCRRAAWGLDRGPCGTGADAPDTVGAHPDGDTPLALHDMAGNVAEWIAPDPARPTFGVARGGSWQTQLAADLRLWASLEIDPRAKDPRVGVRCAYDAP